jgi:hypothetical protein
VQLQDWVNTGSLKRNRDGLLELDGILFRARIAAKKLKTSQMKYPFILNTAYKMLGVDVGDDCPDDYKSIIARAIERKDFAEKDALEEIESYFEQVYSDALTALYDFQT